MAIGNCPNHKESELLKHIADTYEPPHTGFDETAYEQHHRDSPEQVQELIQATLWEQAPTEKRRRSNPWLKSQRVAAVVIAVMGIAVLVLPVEAVQGWREFIMQKLSGAIIISEQVDYRELKRLGYQYIIEAPADCSIDRHTETPDERMIAYQFEDGRTFFFIQTIGNGKQTWEKEGYEEYIPVSITDGITGYYLLNSEHNSSLHWSFAGVRFQLLGEIDRDTAIALANSVIPIS